jgi:signal transduction histidine kinase
LIDTQEEERKRLAGDLHDRMGARLFHIQHNLAVCAQPDMGGAALDAQYEMMRRDLVECNSDVRSLMNELRPNVLDDFGFVEALSEHITGLVAKVPFKLEVSLDPGLQHWRSQQDAMLFRLLQEALLNIRKHANARRVRVSLARVADKVELEIIDDGNGFDPASVPLGHFGVMMMRERAQAAGATFAIASSPGDGTRIALVFPEAA